MKRLAFATVAAAVLAGLALPALASAHPLGNFTINRFSRIEVSGPRIYVRYVLDMAEIPTYQAGRHRCPRLRSAHRRERPPRGRRPPSRLCPYARRSRTRAESAGLRTTRLEVILAGPNLRGGESRSLS